MEKINTENLQNIQNVTLDQFKEAYRNGNSIATLYYQQLAIEGNAIGNSNISNYAHLAESVTTNSGARGLFANSFSSRVAKHSDINFEVGSDNWLEMQHTLMQQDFQSRNLSQTGELDWQDTNTIHGIALEAVGLSINAYSASRPLQIAGESSSSIAQSLFVDMIKNEGGLTDNFLAEAVKLNFGAQLLSYDPSNSVTDIFADNIQLELWRGDAIKTLVEDIAPELIEQYFSNTLNTLQSYGATLTDFYNTDGVDTLLNSGDDFYLNDEIINIYNQNSFTKSFQSLGFSDDVVNQFQNTGWDALGSDNSWLNDNNYSYGNDNYTIFGQSNTIAMQTGPRANSVLWKDQTLGDYNLNRIMDLTLKGWGDGIMNRVSPLTFDLDGDGIESSHIYDQNVFFDIDGDGYAEKVGWIDADDGQLAFDANGDGIINDITELFGDDIMPAFDKLALFDTNGDGLISELDDDYENLLVWRDLDQDGFSDEGELMTLLETGIKEISLAETAMDEYQNENYFSGKATFTWTDNSTGDIVDVHFLNDNVNTWFMGAQSEVYGSTYEVNPEALLLPLSRGYGSLASLHIAMTDNETLRTIMKDLVNLDATTFDQFAEKMEAFLYEWAGVTDNDPDALTTANGSNIDSRKVDFMEIFTGVEWKQMGVADVVGSKASLGVKKIWTEIENMMSVRVLVQGTLADDVFENATYDFVTDSLTLGDTMSDIIVRAQAYIADQPEQARTFWQNMGNILIMHRDELGVTIEDISASLDAAYGDELFIGEQIITADDGDLYTAIDGADEVLQVNTYVGTENDDHIIGSYANDYIFGYGGEDSLEGLSGDDFLRGDDDNDQIEGGDGDDRLEGQGGDDVLNGGDGRDDLRGGDGVDTLNGGDGQDKLHGGAGADSIDGGAGADEIDYLESDAAVFIDLRTMTATGGHAEGDIYINIENITGSNFSDILIGDAQNNILNGEDGDDQLYGGTGDDNLFGAGGNDQLYGEGGDDILFGFDGTETIDGGDGKDLLTYEHPYNEFGVHVDLLQGRGFLGAADGDVYFNIEDIRGTNVSDILVGDDNDNIIEGLGGTDILIGGGGDDIMVGGYGSNHMMGGSGADRFIITPQDVNIVRIYDFDPNEDILDYTAFTTEITQSTQIDLTDIGGNTLISIDNQTYVILQGIIPSDLDISNFLLSEGNTNLESLNIYTNTDFGVNQDGDDFGNILKGTVFDDTIDGADGGDAIDGLDGNDVLNGGAGGDTLMGGIGADILNGGAGNDIADYRDSFQGVTIDLVNGLGYGGAAEGDTLIDIEKVLGSAFDDVLISSDIANELHGYAGNDILHTGQAHNYILHGGAGNDTFVILDASDNEVQNSTIGVFDSNGGFHTTNPTSLTLIKDFEAGNAEEKLDLSHLEITDIYIQTVEDFNVNDSLFSGSIVQILTQNGSQMVLLEQADFGLLNSDNFILPEDFNFADIQWQVIGNYNNNILNGSQNDDFIYGAEGQDIFIGGDGNDVIVSNAEYLDLFVVEKNAGDIDTIYNFSSIHQSVNVYRIGDSGLTLGPDGDNIAYLNRVTNGMFNLKSFANIRDFDDLIITSFDSDGNGSNDTTDIALGDGQIIRLEGFQEILTGGWLDVPGSDSPKNYELLNGNVVYGWALWATHYRLEEDNFVFYDGTLDGDIGADILEGGYGEDNIYGYTGDDIITGAGDDDMLYGGAGQDTLEGGAGNDHLSGGDDADRFIILADSGTTDTISDFEYWRPFEQIDLSAFDGVFTNFQDFSDAISQQGDDTHIDLGNSQIIVLQSMIADHLIADHFIGNAGLNNITVAKNDFFSVDENQIMSGNVLADNGEGLDYDPDGDNLNVLAATLTTEHGNQVELSDDGSFIFTQNSYTGYDYFYYTLSDGYGGISQGRVEIYIDPLIDIFNGTAENDILNGTDDRDEIYGGGGDDTLYGDTGDDLLNGGEGDDTFIYTSGMTIIQDNAGTDTLRFSDEHDIGNLDIALSENGDVRFILDENTNEILVQSQADGSSSTQIEFLEFANGVTVSLADMQNWSWHDESDNKLFYHSADETLNATVTAAGEDLFVSFETNPSIIFSGAGNDAIIPFGDENTVVFAGQGDDDVVTGYGDDIIFGGDGQDMLCGYDGDDIIYGGNDDDILIGSYGSDDLWGGEGADVFEFIYMLIDQDEGVHTIHDFNAAEGDKIDISDLIQEYDPLTESIHDFVQLSQSGDDTILSIDADGQGDRYNFQQVTIISDNQITDLFGVEANGHLIMA